MYVNQSALQANNKQFVYLDDTWFTKHHLKAKTLIEHFSIVYLLP